MPTPRRVVVDDTDSRIRYSGQGWFQDQGSQDNSGNFGPTYKRTSHGTYGNDSLSFTFEGTSINVVGTTNLARIDNNTRWDPGWECFIDNISIGATTPFFAPENNWGLCGKDILNDGQHVITVNVTTTGNTFWLDYLIFTPSPQASYNETVLKVENDDPGIFMDSNWGALGGTANMTTVKGSQAKFNFVGRSVTWVGFVPTELPHASASGSFAIDGGPPTSFALNGLSSTATTTVYNQQFFTTPDLPPGPHSLLVTYNGANTPATPLTLDYLYVTNTSTPNISSTGSTSASTSTGTNVPIPSTQSGGSKTPVGAIVGGVVGGIALIALIFFLFWWRRRQRRALLVHSEVRPTIDGSGTAPYEVTPFMSGYQTPQSYTTYPNSSPQPLRAPALGMPSYSQNHKYGNNPSQSQSQSQSQVSSPQAQPNALPTSSSSNNIPIVGELHTHNHSPSMDSSEVSGYGVGTVAQTRAMRKGQEAARQPAVTSVQHQDSGVRLPQQNVILEDIPPSYTAA